MASEGDIRVLLVMDFVLSLVFCTVVIRGLAFIDVLAFSWSTVVLATVVLAAVTYLIVLR
ncbi:MAG TPA: hypothetical protein VFJ06_03390 [Halococcus sp.]|nr:hypothetical protein [Halococcus sp.]